MQPRPMAETVGPRRPSCRRWMVMAGDHRVWREPREGCYSRARNGARAATEPRGPARPRPHGRRVAEADHPARGGGARRGAHAARDARADRGRRAAEGDALAVARLAGIMAAKRTADLVPLCHPLPLAHVDVELVPDPEGSRVLIESRVAVAAPTGVEMEALTAVAVAGLTLYDMCKAVDREMTLGAIRLVRKTGGRSGTFVRRGERT